MRNYNILMVLCLCYQTLFAPSIDTTTGTNLDKSMTITALWTMDAGMTQTAFGSVAFRQGLRVTGTNEYALLNVYFPIEKQLNLQNGGNLKLHGDLHLDGNLIVYCDAPYSVIRTPTELDRKVIYLDGDVTISGNSAKVGGDVSGLILENVILDGQGHRLILGETNRSGALYLGDNVMLRNVTVQNAWFDMITGSFSLYDSLLEPYAETFDVTLDNVEFSLRAGLPLCFGRFPVSALRRILIDRTVHIQSATTQSLPYAGQTYGILPGEFNVPIIIRDQANLILENTQLIKGWYISDFYGPMYKQERASIFFNSDLARLTLYNSILGTYNQANRAGYVGALETTLTLTKGTIVIQGASAILADAQFPQSRSRISFGDGTSSANDINIIVSAGAKWDFESTSTNCGIIIQNKH